MPVREFPPLDSADERGLLAIGGDLSPETLLLAYRSAIFPWPASEGSPLLWFSPPERTVLMLNDLHISRSVRRAASRNSFSIRFNADFEEVIQHCAKIRKPGTGTWITEEMIEAYTRLFHLGYAYSVVAYEGEAIAGGLYGVVIGKMVTGESMFYLKPDASKLALVALIEKLRSKGVEWLDCQQDTPLLRSFGAVPVPRERFVAMVNEACAAPQLHL